MKAWQLRQGFGEENLELVDAETPRPEPGELLLAMRAASLNYRDLVVIDGLHGPAITTPLVHGPMPRSFSRWARPSSGGIVAARCIAFARWAMRTTRSARCFSTFNGWKT